MSNLSANIQTRKVKIPMHRVKLFFVKLDEIVTIMGKLKLQFRADPEDRSCTASVRSPSNSEENLQKGVDFLTAFSKGFDLQDCASLIRMEGLYIRTMYIKEIKRTIKGDHFTRAVGRICGVNGVMRMKIENATRCRIVINECTVHIMGTLQGVDEAYRKIGALVRGAPINKIVGKLGMVKRKLDATF